MDNYERSLTKTAILFFLCSQVVIAASAFFVYAMIEKAKQREQECVKPAVLMVSGSTNHG